MILFVIFELIHEETSSGIIYNDNIQGKPVFNMELPTSIIFDNEIIDKDVCSLKRTSLKYFLAILKQN